MKRWTLGLMLPVVVALALCGCSSKKKTTEEPQVQPESWSLKSCPVSRIDITPAKTEADNITIASNAEVKLEATAYDAQGNPVNVPLTWHFQHPDTCAINVAGGHQLTVIDDRHATFKAAGLAADDFIIIAEDQSCNLSDKDHPQYPQGIAWVRVHKRPTDEVACGRMRVTYGDDIDRTGERVMASSKVTLLAEVIGPTNTPAKYTVHFYFNDKLIPGDPILYHDNSFPVTGQDQQHFKAMMPIYLTPGKNMCIRYELVKGKEVVCGSFTERFDAR